MKENKIELINLASALSIGIIGFIGIYDIIKKDFNSSEQTNLDIKIEPEYYKKIYDIVIKESELDKDKYSRKPSKKVVKLLCKIAKKSGIKITDPIDKKTFDELYIKLVEYQYLVAKKNNLI